MGYPPEWDNNPAYDLHKEHYLRMHQEEPEVVEEAKPEIETDGSDSSN